MFHHRDVQIDPMLIARLVVRPHIPCRRGIWDTGRTEMCTCPSVKRTPLRDDDTMRERVDRNRICGPGPEGENAAVHCLQNSVQLCTNTYMFVTCLCSEQDRELCRMFFLSHETQAGGRRRTSLSGQGAEPALIDTLPDSYCVNLELCVISPGDETRQDLISTNPTILGIDYIYSYTTVYIIKQRAAQGRPPTYQVPG